MIWKKKIESIAKWTLFHDREHDWVGKGISEEASWNGLRVGHVTSIIINITTKYYKGRERQVLLNHIMDLQLTHIHWKNITSL